MTEPVREDEPMDTMTPTTIERLDPVPAPLQLAKDRVAAGLTEYGKKERSLVSQEEIVNFLLDLHQLLAAVPA